jgi:hypothetical protein
MNEFDAKFCNMMAQTTSGPTMGPELAGNKATDRSMPLTRFRRSVMEY